MNANVDKIKDDLPEQLEGLEEWRAEDEPVINLYPYVSEGKEIWCVSGDTFGLWTLMKSEFGFEWAKNIGGNDSHNAGVIAKDTLDKERFLEFCDEWGFAINEADEVEEEDDDE